MKAAGRFDEGRGQRLAGVERSRFGKADPFTMAGNARATRDMLCYFTAAGDSK